MRLASRAMGVAAILASLASQAALINVNFNGGSYQNGVPNGPTQVGAAAVRIPHVELHVDVLAERIHQVQRADVAPAKAAAE